MSASTYQVAAPEDKVHFTQCSQCGVWFDMRDLDEVLAHHTHKPRRDAQYKGCIVIRTQKVT